MVQETGMAPERILFFDDSQRNIDSAVTEGMVADKTNGLEEVFTILKKLNII